jgi:hypothetical protein
MTHITIEKEKLEKVLETLELSSVIVDSFGLQKKMQEAHATIKQALAAPVQEPMAYCEIHYLPEPCAQCSKEHEGYNTSPAQPAPVQEPVAWLKRHELADLQTCNHRRLGADSPRIWAPNAPDAPPPELDLVAVYTTPPAQRQWVGLTDREYIHITDTVFHQGHGLVAYYQAIAAKLKSKNT